MDTGRYNLELELAKYRYEHRRETGQSIDEWLAVTFKAVKQAEQQWYASRPLPNMCKAQQLDRAVRARLPIETQKEEID